MTKAPQERKLKTHAALLAVATEIVETQGFSNLRVEDVVARAGTAKGTLFAHFGDKDGLLAVIIGRKMSALIEEMRAMPQPQDFETLIATQNPTLAFIGQERMIFELVLRFSGATGPTAEASVAQALIDQIEVLAGWIAVMAEAGQLRDDAPPEQLAEGIQAFVNHVLALWFCLEDHGTMTPQQALLPLARTWLLPTVP